MGLSLLIISIVALINHTSSFYLGWNSILLSLFILFNCFNLWVNGDNGLARRELSGFDFTTEIEEINKKRLTQV